MSKDTIFGVPVSEFRHMARELHTVWENVMYADMYSSAALDALAAGADEETVRDYNAAAQVCREAAA